MGDKISVLMGFSLIQKIVVQKTVAALFTKNTRFFKQDSLALYLKKNLKSSQYMDRQGRAYHPCDKEQVLLNGLCR